MTTWEPDFEALAVSSIFSAAEWELGWLTLHPTYRDEQHWPALVGAATTFTLTPKMAAQAINVLDGAPNE